MIKSDNGMVNINGSVINVLADLTTLIRGIRATLLQAGFTESMVDSLIRDIVEISNTPSDSMEEINNILN